MFLPILMVIAALGPVPPKGWIKDGIVHVRIFDLAKVYGPVKFYVNATTIPGAGCPDCPPGPAAQYVVPPEQVYQEWKGPRGFVELTFPQSLVGNLDHFFYTATSYSPSVGEKFTASGEVPSGQGGP